jgi:hypothetical protein
MPLIDAPQMNGRSVPPVFVCDPGKASGWVEGVGFTLRVGISPRRELLAVASAFAENHCGYGEFVVERFTITERTVRVGRDDTALRIIGVLEFLAEQYDLGWRLQTPASAKSVVPDWRLRALGVWVPGREDHARDAMRHYALWRVRETGLTLPVREAE